MVAQSPLPPPETVDSYEGIRDAQDHDGEPAFAEVEVANVDKDDGQGSWGSWCCLYFPSAVFSYFTVWKGRFYYVPGK